MPEHWITVLAGAIGVAIKTLFDFVLKWSKNRAVSKLQEKDQDHQHQQEGKESDQEYWARQYKWFIAESQKNQRKMVEEIEEIRAEHIACREDNARLLTRVEFLEKEREDNAKLAARIEFLEKEIAALREKL